MRQFSINICVIKDCICIKTFILKNFTLPLFIAALWMISSCNIINPEEEVPTYIEIDSFILETDYVTEGTNSHCITDVWINIDDNLQGIYELPVVFPVLAQGRHKITIRPGIRVNGISASREIYPYYTQYIIDTVLTEGQTIEFNPVTAYKEETIFKWTEDFEDPGTSLMSSPTSNVDLVTSGEDAFEGSNSGKIFIDEYQDVFKCMTIDSFYLPYDGTPVYLEINYKTNSVLTIGLLINKTTETVSKNVIYLNPTTDWNKICIELTDFITYNWDEFVMHYRLYFAAMNNDEGKDVEIYIDNIKLVHR